MLKKTLLTAAAALAIITGATAISTPEAKAGVSINFGGWGGYYGGYNPYWGHRYYRYRRFNLHHLHHRHWRHRHWY